VSRQQHVTRLLRAGATSRAGNIACAWRESPGVVWAHTCKSASTRRLANEARHPDVRFRSTAHGASAHPANDGCIAPDVSRVLERTRPPRPLGARIPSPGGAAHDTPQAVSSTHGTTRHTTATRDAALAPLRGSARLPSRHERRPASGPEGTGVPERASRRPTARDGGPGKPAPGRQSPERRPRLLRGGTPRRSLVLDSALPRQIV
jgi:hypothetical protein